MGDFEDVVRQRRMTRSFAATPLAAGVLERFVDLASRAPSAGKTQGWHLVVLEGAETEQFWNITLPAERRGTFRWQRLLDAPVILLPFADANAYVDRYAEPDKRRSGLGESADAWPVPYWTIDASMSVMTLLLAAENEGLGALFFGVFRGERELRHELGVPEHLELLGAIAIGHKAARSDSTAHGSDDQGRSAGRDRRAPEQIIHRGRWQAADQV